MADAYELVLAMDLRDLDGDALAELRWHVGDGPRPERFPLGGDHDLPTRPLGDPADPDCRWETAAPEPLFAVTGPARHVGGALVAVLAARDEPGCWALTVRQEPHPDEFPALAAVLGGLGAHAAHVPGHPVGHLRFHEETAATPLLLGDGTIALPGEVAG